MKPSIEPLWWAPFAVSMFIGAVCVPALIIITGFVIPFLMSEDPIKLRKLILQPEVRAFLFVVISSSFFHGAHRIRYLLFDLGLRKGRLSVAATLYAAALIGTSYSAWVAFG